MILKPGAKDKMTRNDPQQDKKGKILVKVEDKESSAIFKVEYLVKLVFLASNPRRRFLAPNKNPWPMPSDFTNLMQML